MNNARSDGVDTLLKAAQLRAEFYVTTVPGKMIN